MGVTQVQYPNNGKPKNNEIQISKYGQKDNRNAAPAHRSVLEWVSRKWTLSNDKIYYNRISNRKYNWKSILVKDWSYTVYGTITTVNYRKLW